MKFTPFATAMLLVLTPTAALADGDEDAVEEAAPVALTIESPIEVLMANEQAKAVLLKHMGGNDISLHPMYDQFKAMSLKQVQPFSQGAITEEMLANIAADLAKL